VLPDGTDHKQMGGRTVTTSDGNFHELDSHTLLPRFRQRYVEELGAEHTSAARDDTPTNAGGLLGCERAAWVAALSADFCACPKWRRPAHNPVGLVTSTLTER
jgi:hypothetical protein